MAVDNFKGLAAASNGSRIVLAGPSELVVLDAPYRSDYLRYLCSIGRDGETVSQQSAMSLLRPDKLVFHYERLMALSFALANTDFACHVIGIADLAQLDEALAAVRMGPLPPDALDKLEPVWASNFRTG